MPRVSDSQILEAKIQRIDINEMFELKSLDDVKLYLGWAAARASLSHRGKGALAENGCTLSWGMHKGNRSLWKVKFYAKGPESRAVRKRKTSLPARLLSSDLLMSWVDRQLRLEFEIHGRELERLGLRRVSDWSVDTAVDVFCAKSGLFFWGDEPVMVEENLDIPRRVRNAFVAWKSGEDMRADCSRATFFRMRSDVKRHYGCDIALPAPVEQSNLVVMAVTRILDLRRADPRDVQSKIESLLAA
jgi:II/X family phage/plasmid replication protein